MEVALNNNEIQEILSEFKNIRLYDDKKDLERFGELIAQEWNMGWKQANCTQKYSTETYGQLCASASDYLLVSVDNEDIVQGIIGIYCSKLTNKYNKDINEVRRKRKVKLEEKYVHKDAGKSNVLKEIQQEESYLMEIQKKCSDNILEIFLVDTEHRGTGIAVDLFKALVRILEKLSNKNIGSTTFNNISIFTATFCTYQFYEKIGCIKVATINKFDEEDLGEQDLIYVLDDFSYFDN